MAQEVLGSVRPLRILLVEDDLLALTLMGELFSELRAEVVAVREGRSAEELIERQPFDGIFLDLHLPRVDGLELARKIRNSSLNHRTPTVAVTGLTTPRIMQAAFAAGASFFLAKPIDREKLARLYRAVQGAMAQQRRHNLRIPISAEVQCRSEYGLVRGQGFDLSENGILFQSDGTLTPQTRVALTVVLPTRHPPVTATAMVVRVDESNRAGCRFLEMGETSTATIRDLVTSYLKTCRP